MRTNSETNNLRRTGINAVGDIPWGSHFCHFYETKQDLLDTLVPYFKAGLENNEFCLWVASDPLPAAEAKALLARAVPAFDDFLARGQLEVRDLSDWYVSGGRFDADAVLGRWLDCERK